MQTLPEWQCSRRLPLPKSHLAVGECEYGPRTWNKPVTKGHLPVLQTEHCFKRAPSHRQAICPHRQMFPPETTGQRTTLQAKSKGQARTFCPLHGEQHFTDVLRVVTRALDSSVQSLPTVLCVTVCPRAENKQLPSQTTDRLPAEAQRQTLPYTLSLDHTGAWSRAFCACGREQAAPDCAWTKSAAVHLRAL